jgi:hypothetical protein
MVPERLRSTALVCRRTRFWGDSVTQSGLKNRVFLDVTVCRLVTRYRRFEGTLKMKLLDIFETSVAITPHDVTSQTSRFFSNATVTSSNLEHRRTFVAFTWKLHGADTCCRSYWSLIIECNSFPFVKPRFHYAVFTVLQNVTLSWVIQRTSSCTISLKLFKYFPLIFIRVF